MTWNNLLGTSLDFSDAFRPMLHKRMIHSSHIVSLLYVMGDIGLETYRLQQNAFVHEKTKVTVSLSSFLMERTVFQAVASLLVPTVLITQSVKYSHTFFTRWGKYTKWGPSCVGLCWIPFLPMLDGPIEGLVGKLFGRSSVVHAPVETLPTSSIQHDGATKQGEHKR
jgi:hypothetical protein